ncbi:phosphatase PAP2 family protein [Mucilaginibacter sp. SP1R1]|uniref:phosphatase PAP2 family protein n=1 Tax=Mucilaginibacter sp. SP1R1 TaxID=2723091 RepID=UPI00179916E9|nr:membrane-associated phospholipid phosphatase [Mucilaginibacter sp. SP1R1]
METFINLGVSVLATNLIKITVNRTRPADRYPDEIFVNSPTHNQSFPSGHTSLAFATATTLSMQYHKWYITVPAYAWAASVGYSRMYLGKHYPTDVLAGAAVGIGTAYVGHWFNQKLFKKHYLTSQSHD